MSEELGQRRQQAACDNYADDQNIRRRVSLFNYVRQSSKPQPYLSQFFTWQPDAVVVDLGCGNGLWTAEASQRAPDGFVVALDRSMGMLAAVPANAPSAVRILADGHHLPLRGASADAVIAAWVLYHLADKDLALGEIRRVLRPDGVLVAATNSAEGDPPLYRIVHGSVEEVVGHSIERWIEPLDFTLENGAAVLGHVFHHVETIVAETDFAITDADAVATYAESLVDPIQAELGEPIDRDALVAAVDRRATKALTAGPIEFTRRVAYFIATGSG